MAGRLKLILASGSPRRLQLLAQIGVEPDRLLPVSIDETPKKNELPRNLARRLAREKAAAAVAAL
ncbi:MAG: Maf family protein, partial [Bauldia sp.]|nr:Maf family protein [Bauldia sp.]